jgi:hypothetical protein
MAMKFPGQFLTTLAIVLLQSLTPFDVAALESLDIKEIRAIFNQQKSVFNNFEFPEELIITKLDGAELEVTGSNTIIIPASSICDKRALSIQITHEIGHLIFSERLKNEVQTPAIRNVVRDYNQYLSLQSKRIKLFNEYDKEILKQPNSKETIAKIDLEIAKLNLELESINYISYFLFPLEELFSDLFSIIYYKDPSIMKEGLLCYGAIEASQRDYASKPKLDYIPMDPYGHTDYIYFGHHFLKSVTFQRNSPQMNLERLYKTIVSFLEVYNGQEFSFRHFNQTLLGLEYKNVK